MPLVIRPRVGGSLRLLAASAAVLTLAGGVTSGSAHAATATQSSIAPNTTGCAAGSNPSPVFSAFGDAADYVLAPGGSFEAGTTAGWTLNGNTLVAANDPFNLNATTDVQAVSIKPGTSVVSPLMCIDATNPYLRLVARKATKGNLKVELLYNSGASVKNAGMVVQGSITQPDYSNWAPSDKLNLATILLNGGNSGPTATDVQIRLTAGNDTGNWQVDDVFIDPFRAG